MSAVAEPRAKKAHVWERDPDSWYSEPSWTFDRLFQEELFVGAIHDPSCGRGNVVQSARAAGYVATGSDIASSIDRGNPEAYPLRDFMQVPEDVRFANIVSNPPFNLCDPRGQPDRCFVRKALRQTDGKVAFLLPTVWVNARSWLRQTPLYRVWWLTPRPSIPPRRLLQDGAKASGGTKDFMIMVWFNGYDGPPTFKWLHRDEGAR